MEIRSSPGYRSNAFGIKSDQKCDNGSCDRGKQERDEKDEDSPCPAHSQILNKPPDLSLRIPDSGNSDRNEASERSLLSRHAEEIETEDKNEGEGSGNIALAEEWWAKRVACDPDVLRPQQRHSHAQGIDPENHPTRDEEVGCGTEFPGCGRGIRTGRQLVEG